MHISVVQVFGWLSVCVVVVCWWKTRRQLSFKGTKGSWWRCCWQRDECGANCKVVSFCPVSAAGELLWHEKKKRCWTFMHSVDWKSAMMQTHLPLNHEPVKGDTWGRYHWSLQYHHWSTDPRATKAFFLWGWSLPCRSSVCEVVRVWIATVTVPCCLVCAMGTVWHCLSLSEITSRIF